MSDNDNGRPLPPAIWEEATFLQSNCRSSALPYKRDVPRDADKFSAFMRTGRSKHFDFVRVPTRDKVRYYTATEQDMELLLAAINVS